MKQDNVRKVTVFIPNEWFIQIQEFCFEHNRSYSQYIRQALYQKIIEDQSNGTD
jgi:hypothetical protein